MLYPIDRDICELFTLRDHGDIHGRDLHHYITKERKWSEQEFKDAKRRLNLKGHKDTQGQWWWHSPDGELGRLMVKQMRIWYSKCSSWDEFKQELQKAAREVHKHPQGMSSQRMYGGNKSAGVRTRRFT